MPNIPTRPLLLLVATLLIACGWIAGVWFLLATTPQDPSTLLPLDRTVAVLQNIHGEFALSLKQHVMEMAQIPDLTSHPTAALLRKDDGTLGFAFFVPSFHGGGAFDSSDANVRRVLLETKDEPRLHSSNEYRSLMSTCAATCAYLGFPQLHLSTASSIATLIHINHAIVISPQKDNLTVSFAGFQHSLPALRHNPKDIFADPLFIIHAGNLASVPSMLSSTMQSTPSLVSQTLLQSVITDTFGSDVSATYDLPRLLQGETTVQAAVGIDGNLRVVVEGTDEGDAAQKLLQDFQSRLTSATVENLTFADRFTMRIVRADNSHVKTGSGTVHGWKTQSVEVADNSRSLFLGLRADRYILSNDRDAFRKAIAQEAVPLELLSAAPSALGLLRSDAVSKYLKLHVPTIWNNQSIPSGTGGYLKWKMMQEGTNMTVVFKKD